ncbi:Rv2231c family pyridoxal phosphate-dependent protein CobC [Saccharopolyspora sp. TS4A08]|uniref:Aminotransferase n=1 Tax=Saccharopolyspora ipomoeae TaxID=3042027 RepID=A0ABT6PXL3_9PSEU|nr:Rv2231c family pyridoxal phosphate-dependent protein CobC [Saccharopolyspora sp. TS4A08]MDI2032602.1 Rv2231c family pyridoxal phosphate-dependent protein CobC [Saccharopolyspora sp. TS4A08]
MSGDDRELLRHHGDVDAARGLADFAVNVRLDRPPRWLRARLAEALDDLGSYPSAEADETARRAVADRHGRHPDDVMVLAGAAEGFALLPALRPALAALIHPSFTEPDLALRTAGVPVERVVLDAADGYRLRAEQVPEAADLVVLGNPTNPTSVLHPAEEIRKLLRPGRIVVVDEAFIDAVPGERESVAHLADPGLLVLRSLTKMWGLPGLRAGYALGSPQVLAELGRARPHWPVNSLVLTAVRACCEPRAIAESEGAAAEFTENRTGLLDGLAGVPGVEVVGAAEAPFLLLRVPDGQRVREALRERGIAVRRGDTFPGLDTDHLRVAVRDPEQNSLLVKAFQDVVERG